MKPNNLAVKVHVESVESIEAKLGKRALVLSEEFATVRRDPDGQLTMPR